MKQAQGKRLKDEQESHIDEEQAAQPKTEQNTLVGRTDGRVGGGGLYRQLQTPSAG
jgi:hypothetical protein